MAELRQAAAQDPEYPPILFVFQGSLAQGESFFGEHWPEARAIADPRRRLYKAFGIQRGSIGQVFGLKSMHATTRAMKDGHIPGAPVGDPWLMPGMFLVSREGILWQHHFGHIGDHPDLKRIPAIVASLAIPA